MRPHPYLLAAIRQEFIDRLGQRQLAVGGLKIYTAVDVGMQVQAERAVRSGTANLRRAHGFLRRRKPLQAALLTQDETVEEVNVGHVLSHSLGVATVRGGRTLIVVAPDGRVLFHRGNVPGSETR